MNALDKLEVFKSSLDERLRDSDQVMIFPHKEMDFDAIASSMGVSLISKELNKENHILMGDKVSSLDLGVQKIIDEEKKNFPLISPRKYNGIVAPDSLFILCDVNKPQLIYYDNLDPERVVIIDHHEKDKESFNASLEYIDGSKSSAAEIIAGLLDLFKVDMSDNMANILLTGILLDTNKLTKNVSKATIKSVGALLEKGASMEIAQEYFIEDFYSDRKIQNLINSTIFINYSIGLVKGTIGLTKGRDDVEYTKRELAKAADYLLRYRIDGAFVIGNIGDGVTAVSARSKHKLNVGELMQELSGGGTLRSGATKLTNTSINEVGKRLIKVLNPKRNKP